MASVNLNEEFKKKLDAINKKIAEKEELNNDDMIYLFFVNLFKEG